MSKTVVMAHDGYQQRHVTVYAYATFSFSFAQSNGLLLETWGSTWERRQKSL